MAGKKRRALPGFGLSLGFTLFYLSVLVLIPLAGCFVKASSLSWDEFFEWFDKDELALIFEDADGGRVGKLVRRTPADRPSATPPLETVRDERRGPAGINAIQLLEAQHRDVEALFRRYRTYWLAHHDDRTRAFPEALDVVRGLAAAGHPIGVVTAKIEQGALRTLAHTGLLPYVQAIVGADSCANAKPHPEPVLLALTRLGYPPTEAVLVGDSPHDIAAAKAAGAIAVAALWGACGREALAVAGPDQFLADVAEVPGLVRSL
jgi:pyrophosphatase PpaX